MISPIQEIKSFVAENRTSDALSRLRELSQSNKQVHDAVHIVLAEFNDLTSQRLKGTIDNSEATRRLNIIHDKVLIALGAFDGQGRVLRGAILRNAKSSSSNAIIVLSLFSIFFAIIFFRDTEGGDVQVMSLILGFCSFIGLLLVVIISAFKSK